MRSKQRTDWLSKRPSRVRSSAVLAALLVVTGQAAGSAESLPIFEANAYLYVEQATLDVLLPCFISEDPDDLGVLKVDGVDQAVSSRGFTEDVGNTYGFLTSFYDSEAFFGNAVPDRIVGVLSIGWRPTDVFGVDTVEIICTVDGSPVTYSFEFWDDYVGGDDQRYQAWYFFEAEPAAEPVVDPVNPMTLSCSPDPVAVGAVVTCVIEKGDPGIEILWRASYNPAFAGQGVKLDAEGNGSFSFVAPAAALGLPVTVELVEWDRSAVVTVGGPVPASVPAGEGEGGLPLGLALGGLVVLAGASRLRRSGAVA